MQHITKAKAFLTKESLQFTNKGNKNRNMDEDWIIRKGRNRQECYD